MIKCFRCQRGHVKYLKNDVSVSVLCKYRQASPFMAVENWGTLVGKMELKLAFDGWEWPCLYTAEDGNKSFY